MKKDLETVLTELKSQALGIQLAFFIALYLFIIHLLISFIHSHSCHKTAFTLFHIRQVHLSNLLIVNFEQNYSVTVKDPLWQRLM